MEKWEWKIVREERVWMADGVPEGRPAGAPRDWWSGGLVDSEVPGWGAAGTLATPTPPAQPRAPT